MPHLCLQAVTPAQFPLAASRCSIRSVLVGLLARACRRPLSHTWVVRLALVGRCSLLRTGVRVRRIGNVHALRGCRTRPYLPQRGRSTGHLTCEGGRPSALPPHGGRPACSYRACIPHCSHAPCCLHSRTPAWAQADLRAARQLGLPALGRLPWHNSWQNSRAAAGLPSSMQGR